jgi:hypothetical protein
MKILKKNDPNIAPRTMKDRFGLLFIKGISAVSISSKAGILAF